MRIDESYLSGQMFHIGKEFNLKNAIHCKMYSKVQYMLYQAKGKKVIHLGFCNHISEIDKEISNGTWLHERLCKVASKCIGIDIDEEAVDKLKQLGYNDIYCLDVTSPPPVEFISSSEIYDYILIPDVLEHLDNPKTFLEALQANYGDIFNEIIISVPNVFWIKNTMNAFKTKEVVNTDHRHWFSPYTLSKYLYNANFRITQMFFANHEYEREQWLLEKRNNNKRFRAVRAFLRFIYYLPLRTIYKLFPAIRGMIICHASSQKKQPE